MSLQYKELLKETFEDLEHLKPENVKLLAEQTIGYFKELQGKFGSSDVEEKKAVENEVLELKELLEGQMDKILQMTGLSTEQLTAMAQTDLGAVEKEAILTMKEQLQDMQPAKSPSKKQKLRILG
jgi:hypothetical protein